ncbi:TPA: hypothetical protein L5E06_004891 [Pseudomonas aeruginosa]|nr:hypothetical protein [Pseudomonas aeruginosa]
MLVVRLKKGWTLKLDRKVNDANRAGVWSFHCSESTFAPSSNDLRRTAAILPAEPKEGQAVEVSICESPHSPDGWIAVGSGVAAYEAER